MNNAKKPIARGLQIKQIRYVITGGTAFVIEYLCFAICLALTNHLLFSNSLSFIIGVAAGFLMHKYWSFAGQHYFKTRYQMLTFLGLSIFNFFFVNVMIQLLVSGLGVWPYAAKFVVIILITLWNFLIFSRLIFRHKV